MKKCNLLFFLLLIIHVGYGQNYNAHFEYEKLNPTAVIVENRPVDSLIQMEKVVLDGFDTKILFYHFITKKNFENRYAILMHGLGGNKDYWVNPSLPYLQYTQNLTSIKDSLLQMGFNIVVIDAKYHGERSYELNFRNPGSLPPMRSKNVEDAQTLYDLYASSVKEVRLIMDYLEERFPSQNIKFNLIGYSMGGALSLILNNVDPRIHCVVACVPPMSRPYSEIAELNWSQEISEKLKAISPLYSITAQKAPVAMLMGNSDFFIPENEANTFYNNLTLENKKLKFYDSGHELPNSYMEDVLQWIKAHN
ncbi:alpha/beta hydrolase family protein [Flagellimonas sp. GZD32]|uniref:alpha/beta hydrolase family protein n=1 Tax=Flagellimonas cixiensis TaxID=3228750 RepID=UPI0035C91AE3